MNTTASAAESELELAKRFAEGDRKAFGQLYEKYAPLILGYLTPRCQRDLSAGDVAQEIWLRVWRGRETFDGTNFRAWLFQIAHNHIVSEYRRKRPTQLPKEFDVVAIVSESRSETLIALRECLRQIGSEFVAVIKAQLAGETTEQIAERLEIAVSTVYTRVNRAKEQLRECVKQRLA